MAVRERGKGQVGHQVLKGIDDVSDASQNIVGRGGGGHAHVGREPGDCVADACGMGVEHPYDIALVGLQCGPKVPPFHPMW